MLFQAAAACQPDLFSMQPRTALAEAAPPCTQLSRCRSTGAAGEGAHPSTWISGFGSESLETHGVAAGAFLGPAVLSVGRGTVLRPRLQRWGVWGRSRCDAARGSSQCLCRRTLTDPCA